MKILVAEDDRNILEGIVEVLEMEGYDPIPAHDGEEAITQWKAMQPDFVILDIMMPRMNGYDVCKAIRREDARIPILFLSAKAEEIDKVIGLELGADDYISKPFGIKELIARIRAVSRRSAEREATQERDAPQRSFTMGDVEVSPSELRARREGNTIELSQRDVQILQVLYREQGKVVNRDTLFDECWGMNYLPNSRTLDQHISQLRKKVERDPKHPSLIRTVHGVGYRYE